MRLALVLCMLVLSVSARATCAQTPDAKTLVKFDLLASTDAPAPGKPFTLAIRAKIEKNWHIYWLNPGDSGMPTSFKLTLPDGWKAGEIQYPIPHKFDQPGGFVGYGYMDEAVFLVEITPPADAKIGAKIGVESIYLVCDKICLPGRQLSEIEGHWRAGTPTEFDAWGLRVPASQYMRLPCGIVIGHGGKVTGSLTKEWSTFDVQPDASSDAGSSPLIEVFPVARGLHRYTQSQIGPRQGVHIRSENPFS